MLKMCERKENKDEDEAEAEANNNGLNTAGKCGNVLGISYEMWQVVVAGLPSRIAAAGLPCHCYCCCCSLLN